MHTIQMVCVDMKKRKIKMDCGGVLPGKCVILMEAQFIRKCVVV
jgi:hypothetical protein